MQKPARSKGAFALKANNLLTSKVWVKYWRPYYVRVSAISNFKSFGLKYPTTIPSLSITAR